MTEYRIVELHRRFHIEERINGKEWHDVRFENVPRYFDTLADARSWVATIKKGVVYHDAEDAPNLAQDERKAEDDMYGGTRQPQWFLARVGKIVRRTGNGVDRILFRIADEMNAWAHYRSQHDSGFRYSDPH